ncbi:MAG: 4-aminobutyrate--2-oxoglutarate transaminase [Betaproteobacteria bacterium]|nr:MAG: 4-aminobutyrate--2-oxoglutarate transaminase [Betaproteobacteria bacterium]
MTTNMNLAARRANAVPRGVASMHAGIYAARAEGAEVWDTVGRRYIDFSGGIAVLNTGHRHPKVLAAVRAQLDRFTHTAFQVLPYELYIALAERLNRLAPGEWPKKTLLLTTGAEAIENAVKIARAYTRRPAVIAFGGAFHGRTLLALGLTGKVEPYKTGFGPFPADLYHVPFPNPLYGVSSDDALAAIAALFKSDIEPERVAAFLIEPVQGEGGFYVAPPPFLSALRRLCDEHGILLIVDEIQSGAARTGRMFAIEHSGVVPDLIAAAKSLAGGFPLSAIIGRAEIMDAVAPGGLGGTYAGNPLGCAAALAVLDVIEGERLAERATRLGERLLIRLGELARRTRRIGDVRGLGAMVAIEFFKNLERREPDPDFARDVVADAARRGLILLSCGTYGNVIRLLMPLTAPDTIVDEGLAILEQCVVDAEAPLASAA